VKITRSMREVTLAVADGTRPLWGWETLAMACAAGLLTVDGDGYAVTAEGRAVADAERDKRNAARVRARARAKARHAVYADLGMRRTRNGGYE